MERIELGTPDLTQGNIQKLGELFPQVLTEVQDENGQVQRAVDFDALRDLLGDVAEGTRERYQFTWPGKREAKAEARRPIEKTMRPCPEESVDWDTTENLYIEGDNLDALKILKETYAGKVKMIYIDPPYNTGHDFVYDDDFAVANAEHLEESGQLDERGKLVTNLESNGRFHSDWCSMMYPRLMLARDLLSADGVIFISIDDNECANLAKICDEVFAGGFLNRMTWISNLKGRQIGGSGAAKCAESILVYGKRADEAPLFKGYIEQLKKLMPSSYKGLNYEVLRDAYGEYVIKNELYNSNSAFNEETRKNLVFDICWDPVSGDVITCDCDSPVEDRYIRISPHKNSDGVHKHHAWRWGRDKIARETHDLHFEKTGAASARVFTKVRDYDVTALKDVLSDLSTSTGVKDATDTFDGRSFFDFAKPVDLIRVLVRSCTCSGDIVLDFFSGSATTAHSVMRQNQGDLQDRKYILIQIPELVDSKSEAAKAGYVNICEIGKERIRRAGAKIKAEVEEANRQLKLGEEPKKVPDIGFRVLKIDSSNFADVVATPYATSQQMLLDFSDNLKDGRSDMDILFEVLPKFEIPYSAKIEEITICGKRCFNVSDGLLIACFDKDVDTDTIEAIAKMQPLYAAMRDASMANDATHANFEELFKTYSPDTIRRVI